MENIKFTLPYLTPIEYTPEKFRELVLMEKRNQLNEFDQQVFDVLETTKEKILFKEKSKDLITIVERHFKNGSRFYETVYEDNVFSRSGMDAYEILYYYEDSLTKSFRIKFKQIEEIFK